jgi:hypothetical protein
MTEAPRIDWLRRLPELEPPESLWRRISARHRVERRGRGLALAIAAGVAAMGLALTLLVAPPVPEVEPRARADGLEALIADNQRLFEALQSRRPDPETLAAWQRRDIRALELELAALDRRLQEGHARAGAQLQLEPLWRERADLLHQLISVHEQPRHVRRI